MLPQGTRAHDVSLQDISLAHFKQSISVQHGQGWQAPQQDEQSSRDAAPVPGSSLDDENQNNNARNKESSGSQTTQRNQIGFVDVRAGEKENQSKKPNRYGTKGSDHLIERPLLLV